MKADGGNPWWSSGWLGLCAFTAVDQVHFLVRKLRSHKLRNGAKKKKKERKKERKKMKGCVREGRKLLMPVSLLTSVQAVKKPSHNSLASNSNNYALAQDSAI